MPKKRPSATVRASSDSGTSVEKRAREGDDGEEDDGVARKKGGQRIETLVDRISEFGLVGVEAGLTFLFL